jgi:F-type H+-transporting ATPase subunit c
VSWNSPGVPANDKGGIVGVIGYGLGVIGAGLGIGLAAYGSTTSMARQPEVQGRLFTVFILASAFVEALALIGFVVTLIA